MTKPSIGFAGLTHLGLVSAVASAAKGFTTQGYDPDSVLISRLQAGELPVLEPGLEALYRENRSRLSFGATANALRGCDVVYVSTDVPTDDSGASDLTLVGQLIESVLPALRTDAILVVLSQVPPGFTRQIDLAPERLFYQVETLVFGNAVERAVRPERYIVGCAEPARPLPALFVQRLAADGCPVLTMRYESAEFAKISINCCLSASIAVSNTLAELCEKTGADWGEIAPALKLDRRIGPNAYLAPGLGIGGGNIERDLATVAKLALDTGSEAGLFRSVSTNSRHRRDWPLRILHRELLAARPDATIAILGLAYKEGTRSVKNSPSLSLIESLSPWRIRIFDPVVSGEAVEHPARTQCANALEAARGADALVVMTPWSEFRELDMAEIKNAMSGTLLLDPFRVLDAQSASSAGLRYFTLGRAAAEPRGVPHA